MVTDDNDLDDDDDADDDGDDDGDVVGFLRRPTPRQVNDNSWKMNRNRTTLHHTIQLPTGLL